MKKTVVFLMFALFFTMGCEKKALSEEELKYSSVSKTEGSQEYEIVDNYSDSKVVLDRKISDSYLREVDFYFKKIKQQPIEKIWKQGLAVGVPDTITGMVTIEGREYEMFARSGDINNESILFFRSTGINGGFPIQRVIFTYDHKKEIGHLEDRVYFEEGDGKQLGEQASIRDFEGMLALADKIMQI